MYVITLARNEKRESIFLVWFLQFCLDNDIHRWIIAKETSLKGYKHWQIRADLRWDFDTVKTMFPTAHIEQTQIWSDYERKEGSFYAWDDNIKQLKQRFGDLKFWQKDCLARLEGNTISDREIFFIVDKNGGLGKSWLAGHIHETGKGFVVPEGIANEPGKIIPFVCSGIKPHHKILVIDIPRANKVDKKMAVILETLKNGLIYDHRYRTVQKNIDCKIVVFTNHEINKTQLSEDRYYIVSDYAHIEKEYGGEP